MWLLGRASLEWLEAALRPAQTTCDRKTIERILLSHSVLQIMFYITQTLIRGYSVSYSPEHYNVNLKTIKFKHSEEANFF